MPMPKENDANNMTINHVAQFMPNAIATTSPTQILTISAT
jgi:hypothetical protein